MKTVLAWTVQRLITILISKNYGKNGMNLFRVEKTKVNEEEIFVIVCGKYRASKAEFKTKEDAEDYIANMIDWDMLVTIVGQLSEHIAEKKVNEMLNNK